jgi:hypothetical protein
VFIRAVRRFGFLPGSGSYLASCWYGEPESGGRNRSYNPTFGREVSRKETGRHGHIHQGEACGERVLRMSAATSRGAAVPGGLVGAGISLIVIVGLIHLIDSPEDLEEGSYQGLLFLANFFGALAAAIGIYRGNRWGWVLGCLVAGGAFLGYVISRTVGLPWLPVETEWLEPLGVLSLLVEGLYVGLCLAILVRPTQGTTIVGAGSPAPSPDIQQGGSS